MENNELLKEIERLQGLLAKHGICEDCGELYNHHIDEPFASCGCKQSEWYELTPHMLQVQGLKVEAGRLGFIAGFNESGEGFNGEYGASDKRISKLADEYAATVQQGGEWCQQN